ncbi:hypothetical protein ABPG72_009293 [Tetrahymena utriculariae]
MSNSSFQFYGVQQIPFANSCFPNNNSIWILSTFNYFTQNNQVINLRNDSLSNYTIQCYNIKLASSINLKLIFLKLIIQSLQNQGSINHNQLVSLNLQQQIYQQLSLKWWCLIIQKNIILIFTFQNSLFQQNVALSSRGALYLDNLDDSCVIDFDKKSLVTKNKAFIGGGLRYVIIDSAFSVNVPLGFPFEANIYQNFAEIFGEDSTSYLYDMIEMVPQNYKSSYSKSADINQFQSGANLNIRVYLIDNKNRYLSISLHSLQNGIYPLDKQQGLKNIQIFIDDLNSQYIQIVAQRILNYQQYDSKSHSFIISNLQIQGKLKTQQFFSLTSNIYQTSQIQKPVLLGVTFRNFIVGEIIQQLNNQISIFKYCSKGSYSLKDPQTLLNDSQNNRSNQGKNDDCNYCPSSALAYEGIILYFNQSLLNLPNLSRINSCQSLRKGYRTRQSEPGISILSNIFCAKQLLSFFKYYHTTNPEFNDLLQLYISQFREDIIEQYQSMQYLWDAFNLILNEQFQQQQQQLNDQYQEIHDFKKKMEIPSDSLNIDLLKQLNKLEQKLNNLEQQKNLKNKNEIIDIQQQIILGNEQIIKDYHQLTPRQDNLKQMNNELSLKSQELNIQQYHQQLQLQQLTEQAATIQSDSDQLTNLNHQLILLNSEKKNQQKDLLSNALSSTKLSNETEQQLGSEINIIKEQIFRETKETIISKLHQQFDQFQNSLLNIGQQVPQQSLQIIEINESITRNASSLQQLEQQSTLKEQQLSSLITKINNQSTLTNQLSSQVKQLDTNNLKQEIINFNIKQEQMFKNQQLQIQQCEQNLSKHNTQLNYSLQQIKENIQNTQIKEFLSQIGNDHQLLSQNLELINQKSELSKKLISKMQDSMPQVQEIQQQISKLVKDLDKEKQNIDKYQNKLETSMENKISSLVQNIDGITEKLIKDQKSQFQQSIEKKRINISKEIQQFDQKESKIIEELKKKLVNQLSSISNVILAQQQPYPNKQSQANQELDLIKQQIEKFINNNSNELIISQSKIQQDLTIIKQQIEQSQRTQYLELKQQLEKYINNNNNSNELMTIQSKIQLDLKNIKQQIELLPQKEQTSSIKYPSPTELMKTNIQLKEKLIKFQLHIKSEIMIYQNQENYLKKQFNNILILNPLEIIWIDCYEKV